MNIRVFGNESFTSTLVPFRSRLGIDFSESLLVTGEAKRKLDVTMVKVENSLKYYAIIWSNNELKVYRNQVEREGRLVCTISRVKDFSMNEYNILCIKLDENGLFAYDSVKETFELVMDSSRLYKFAQISCGNDFCLALTSDGRVLSSGYGLHGQLGKGSLDDSEKFEIIQDLTPVQIKQISTGSWHSLALSEDGDVYAWGWNQLGQVGLTSGALRNTSDNETTTMTNAQLRPYPLDGVEEIISVACGSRHSVILSKSGHVYTFGWNGFGQLGRDPSYNPKGDSACDKILPIGEVLDNVQDVYCSFWSTRVSLKHT